MMMVAVPVVPMLDPTNMESSIWGASPSRVMPVMAMSPVFQTCPLQYGQCMTFPAPYEQQVAPPSQLLHQEPPWEQFGQPPKQFLEEDYRQDDDAKTDVTFHQVPQQVWPKEASMKPLQISLEHQWDNVRGAVAPSRRRRKMQRRGITDSPSSSEGCTVATGSDGSTSPGSNSASTTPASENGDSAARTGNAVGSETVTAPVASPSEPFQADPMKFAQTLTDGFQVMRRRDKNEIRAHLEKVMAPDVVMCWPDMAREIVGRNDVVEHALRSVEDIPDLEMILEHAVAEDGSLRAFHCVKGTATQSNASQPFFRAGRYVCMHISTLITFDNLGRVKRRQAFLNLGSTIPLSPSLLDSVLENVLALSSTPTGSRVLLFATENVDLPAQTTLAQQFRNHVWDASASPHANHVLQKLIERMPTERLDFFCTEMEGSGVVAAQHPTRCRVLERLIEHCAASKTTNIVEEVIQSGAALVKHAFGNFIVQVILEHGTEDQRARLSAIVLSDVHRFAKHKIASNVVRAALVHSPPEQREMLVEGLTADPRELASLANHRIGSFVVREVKLARGT